MKKFAGNSKTLVLLFMQLCSTIAGLSHVTSLNDADEMLSGDESVAFVSSSKSERGDDSLERNRLRGIHV